VRILAGMGLVLALCIGGAAAAAAQQAHGSISVGVRICGAETPGCKTATAKPRRFRVARSGFVPRVAFATPSYTCGAAAISVAQAGFTAIRRLDCRGRTFAYSARRNGRHYRIEVEAGSGDIKSIAPLKRARKLLA
jgi:hypothetical protein